jgi:hypothetical protein
MTNKVIIKEDVACQLAYFYWDTVELERGLPEAFPNANSIEVTDCEDSYIEVKMDGEYYVLDATLEVIEKGRM